MGPSPRHLPNINSCIRVAAVIEGEDIPVTQIGCVLLIGPMPSKGHHQDGVSGRNLVHIINQVVIVMAWTAVNPSVNFDL